VQDDKQLAGVFFGGGDEFGVEHGLFTGCGGGRQNQFLPAAKISAVATPPD
jgi:hypothetical protein